MPSGPFQLPLNKLLVIFSSSAFSGQKKLKPWAQRKFWNWTTNQLYFGFFFPHRRLSFVCSGFFGRGEGGGIFVLFVWWCFFFATGKIIRNKHRLLQSLRLTACWKHLSQKSHFSNKYSIIWGTSLGIIGHHWLHQSLFWAHLFLPIHHFIHHSPNSKHSCCGVTNDCDLVTFCIKQSFMITRASHQTTWTENCPATHNDLFSHGCHDAGLFNGDLCG